MTRSDLLTARTARTAGAETVAGRPLTWANASNMRTSSGPASSVAVLDAPAREVRRRNSRRDPLRPDAGAVDYVRRSPGVSQTPHEEREGFGIAKSVGVALITAVSALGLVGLANLSAGEVPAPAAVSVQMDNVQAEYPGFGTGR